MAQDTKYEGINFNTDWISSFTSVGEFISSASHLLLGENQEAKLTELYHIVNGKPESKPKKKAESGEAQ